MQSDFEKVRTTEQREGFPAELSAGVEDCAVGVEDPALVPADARAQVLLVGEDIFVDAVAEFRRQTEEM